MEDGLSSVSVVLSPEMQFQKDEEVQLQGFRKQLEDAAKVFLKLLRASKSLKTLSFLPTIKYICEVVVFFEEQNMIGAANGKTFKVTKEQSTQTFPQSESQTQIIDQDCDSVIRKSKRTKFVSIKMLDYDTETREKKKTTSRSIDLCHSNGSLSKAKLIDLDLDLDLDQQSTVHCNKTEVKSDKMNGEDLSSKQQLAQLSNEFNEEKSSPALVPPLLCSICGDLFEGVGSLEQHLRSNHSHETLSDRKGVNRDTINSKVTGDNYDNMTDELSGQKQEIQKQKFHCQFCQRRFSLYRELKCHLRNQHKEPVPTCDKCGKRFAAPNSLKRHKTRFCHYASGKLKKQGQAEVHTLVYKCDVCGLSYTGTARLNVHKLKHTSSEEASSGTAQDENRFKCDMCGRMYTSKIRLSNHLVSHGKESDWKCETCDKRFPFRKDLNIHNMTHMRKKDKEYSCHVCGVTSLSLSAFQCHIKTHQIDRPYVCTTCGKSFMRIHELQKHNTTVHMDLVQTPEGVETYICEMCAKVYNSKAGLQIHMKIHLGIFDHPCEFCEKKFKTLAELNHHRRVHTQEKPYKCDTCQRAFTRQSTLVNHKRIHTGELRALCNECGKRFRNSNDLVKHLKRVHKDSSGKGEPTPALEVHRLVEPPIADGEMIALTSLSEVEALDTSSAGPIPVSAVIVTPQPPDEPYVTLSLSTNDGGPETSQIFVTQDLKPEVTALLQMDTPVLHQQHDVMEAQTIELWFE